MLNTFLHQLIVKPQATPPFQIKLLHKQEPWDTGKSSENLIASGLEVSFHLQDLKFTDTLHLQLVMVKLARLFRGL